MRKNRVIAVLMVLVMVISASISILVSGDDGSYNTAKSASYFSETCGHYHYVTTLQENVPTFIDQETGEVWIAIDSRLCQHGLWGLDILYAREGDEADVKWICHGSRTMDEYVVQIDCCDDDAYAHNLAQPFTVGECRRIGCKGTIVTTITDSPVIRDTQRLCTHLPWGVDILYAWTRIETLRCHSCGHGTQMTSFMSSWVCYGFR